VTLLAIEDLAVAYPTRQGSSAVIAVRQVSLAVARGECLAIVGESGSGKSQLCLATAGLAPRHARVTGAVRYAGRDLLRLREGERRRLLGRDIGFVFQDPSSALTPHLTVASQLMEVRATHHGGSAEQRRRQAREALARVRIADPERRLDCYPHELSGGMRQRVALAAALIGEPALLFADEPTTALDVTVQTDLVALLREEVARGLALVLVTHDFGVVAGIADRVAVMRHGEVVECGPVGQLLAAPRHEYTRGLLAAVPALESPA
jgi:ABC-type glutathione transport system ATPase component